VQVPRILAVLIGLGSAAFLLHAQTPYGVHPRASASDYAVSQQTPSGKFAASLVPKQEVKRLFSVDISNTYAVFEVACYPSGSVQLAAGDFVVKSGGMSADYTHPADAVTVASVIQDKNTPRPPSRNTTTVVTNASIGYASETDPYTGRKVHGVYTEAGAGVGTGLPDAYPPGPPPKGSTDYDRMTLQQQLAARALPDGSFTAPVAGFLYFPAKEVKKKDGVYELDYLGVGAGTTRLFVPAKR
jgi:hypothetical protein